MTYLSFTLADLLILLAVGAVLFLYRQSDKKNRSLERVKRFTDQAQIQLQEIVDARARDLKDLGIEVEVHQETLKTVLHHVQEATSDLEQKADAIDALSAKMKGYDDLIQDVVQQTKIAQENLQRIKDESRFVDGVGKRIKEASQQISGIEKSIPELIQNFEKKNTDTHKITADGLLLDFQASIKEGEAQVDQRKQTIAGLLEEFDKKSELQKQSIGKTFQHFQEQALVLQEQYQAHIDKAVQAGRNFEIEILQKLQSDFTQQIEEKQNSIQQNINEVDRRFKTSLSEILSQRDEQEKELQEWKISYAQRFVSLDQDLQEELQEKNSFIENQLSQLVKTLQEMGNDFEERLQEFSQRQEDGFDSGEKLFQTQQENFSSLVYQQEERIKIELEKVREKGNALADQAMTRMNQDIETKSDSIRSQIQKHLEDLEIRSQNSHTTITKNFSELQNRLDTYIQESKGFIDQLVSQMESVQEKIHTDQHTYDSLIKEFMDNSRSRIENQEETISDQLKTLADQLALVKQEATVTIHDLRSEFSHQSQQVRSEIDERIVLIKDEYLGYFAEARQDLTKDFQGIKEDQASAISRIEEDLKVSLDLAVSQVDGLRNQFDENAREIESRFSQSLETYELHLSDTSNQLNNHFDQELKNLQNTIQTKLDQSGEQMERLSLFQSEIDQKHDQISGNFQAKVHGFEKAMKEKIEYLEGQLSLNSQGVEQQVLKELENRLHEYEEAFGYRIQSIEQVSTDIAGLESELRKLVERSGKKLADELLQLSQGMKNERAKDLETAREEMSVLNQEMSALEQSLNDLKDRAYDSASEKLKSFEDEFFGDLKVRSEKMENQLEEWQIQVRTILDDLGKNAEDTRVSLEHEYLQNLKDRLGKLQNQTADHMERMDAQLLSHQQKATSIISEQEKIFAAQDVSVRNELQQLHENLMLKMNDQYSLFQNQNQEKLTSIESTVDLRVRKLETSMHDRSAQVEEMFETVRSDVGLWQSKVYQQLTSAQSSFDAELDQSQRKMQEQLAGLEDSLGQGMQAMLDRISDDQDAITQAVQHAQAHVQDLVQSIQTKTSEAQNAFVVSRDEAQQDIELKLREFRSSASAIRDEFETAQRRLFGDMESRTQQLDATLQEIDKRQKQFLAQTKLFERADTLKIELTEDIDRLKQEAEKIRVDKKDFDTIEAQVSRIKSLGEESNTKLDRINSEKKRLDSLEENLNRLLSVAQSVDGKLAQAQSQQDQLVEMQKTLRDLGELERLVEQRFERLEKKSGILETTIEGVDKNFQQLTDLEQKFVAIYKDIEDTIPGKLISLETNITQLSMKKKEADLAVKQLSQLDGLIKDVEARIGEIQKNREWLARTETRFEEITRQATDQVQILSTLVKDELKTSSNDPDAIPKSARDLVIRLAHQGWKIEEIARTTKLSRGEVELILEMKSR